MLNFLAIVFMLIAMFFSFGQGLDEGKGDSCKYGFRGAILFSLVAMLFILVR